MLPLKTKNPTMGGVSRRVPGAGLEPARLIQPTDFKSVWLSSRKCYFGEIWGKFYEVSSGKRIIYFYALNLFERCIGTTTEIYMR